MARGINYRHLIKHLRPQPLYQVIKYAANGPVFTFCAGSDIRTTFSLFFFLGNVLDFLRKSFITLTATGTIFVSNFPGKNRGKKTKSKLSFLKKKYFAHFKEKISERESQFGCASHLLLYKLHLKHLNNGKAFDNKVVCIYL